MTEPIFEGVVPAIFTPMHDDGAVNHDELAAQVRRQRAAGAAGVFCAGTNGEFYALTREERVAVARTCAAAAEGAPVMAGVGFDPVPEALALIEAYAAAGARAASLLVPYFVDCTQDGIAAYIAAVADRAALPLVIYDIPAKARNTLEPATVAALARHPNVAGLKDSSGDAGKLDALSRIEGLQVMTGSDGLILRGLDLGMTAFVSGFANVAPEAVCGIVAAWRAGDRAGAERCQARVQALRAMLALGNPGTVTKRAAVLLGHSVGPARPPCTAEPEIDAPLRAILARAGIASTKP